MNQPWLPYMVTTFLDGYLQPDMQAFEWGSGDSTSWLAERVKRLVSVEHNPEWYARLPDLDNVEKLLVEPEPELVREDIADPLAYYSRSLGDVNLKQYATAIRLYELFDLVLVDGRARPSCLLHAHPHVKPGGVLVLDNSDRPYYLEHTVHLFESWDRMDVLGHGPKLSYQWKATAWRRPNEPG
jgi:predicted O-methyltransferase YrrM